MGLYCDILSIPAHAIDKCEQFADNEKALVDHIQSSAANWFDIDKAWHGIHFLLNPAYPNVSWPNSFLFQGGTALNNRDWSESYGVNVPDFRVFTPDQVKEINTMLNGVSGRTLLRRYNPDLLKSHSIYPEAWESKSNRVAWFFARYLRLSINANYLMSHFQKLHGFLQSTALPGNGLVIKYHQ